MSEKEPEPQLEEPEPEIHVPDYLYDEITPNYTPKLIINKELMELYRKR